MRFTPSPLADVVIIDVEPAPDDRGWFARSYCDDEFSAAGVPTAFVQNSVSFNRRAATLRGLHFQRDPFAEGKLIRCTQGAICDVIVDLRPKSPTFCRWASVELSAENHRQIFVPAGFAHGFQTLVDDSEVLYWMTERHHPAAAAGVRWDDPVFGIVWPDAETRHMSSRDASYPDFDRSMIAPVAV